MKKSQCWTSTKFHALIILSEKKQNGKRKLWSAVSVKGSGVHVSIRLEITQFVAVLVVVQQTETLITVQTRIHRSMSVVRRYPSEGRHTQRKSVERSVRTGFGIEQECFNKKTTRFIFSQAPSSPPSDCQGPDEEAAHRPTVIKRERSQRMVCSVYFSNHTFRPII